MVGSPAGQWARHNDSGTHNAVELLSLLPECPPCIFGLSLLPPPSQSSFHEPL